MNLSRFFGAKTMVLLVVLAVVGIVADFRALNNYFFEAKPAQAAGDFTEAEYIIEGERVRLADGMAESPAAPGSAAKIITRYFGNELRTDLNDDERKDVVFLLTQETGGSGTFYYVVAALNTNDGYVGSEALFLGDRIAPQTMEKGSGKIVVVNYAHRAPGEAFSTAPSVGKSIWLVLDPKTMQFGEVDQDFAGEANSSSMSLQMKTWTWVSLFYSDDSEVRPASTEAFTLTFTADGRFSATTDCNRMGGSYAADGRTISFSQMMSTKMYCEGSQEDDFAALLEAAQSYHFTSRGELIFDLKFDSGIAVFKSQ